MFNGMSNDVLIQSIEKVSFAIKALSAEGVTVKSVTMASNKPVIRVQPCVWCQKQIHSGRAVYIEFGCSIKGRYRQGQFMSGGCKVVWSESLH